MPLESQKMPIVFELLFLCAAIRLFLASTARSWRSHREWKRNQKSSSRTRYQLPLKVRLENTLLVLAAMLCFVVITADWRFRTLIGTAALLGVGIALYRLNSKSAQATKFDESSVLHIGPTGAQPPL